MRCSIIHVIEIVGGVSVMTLAVCLWATVCAKWKDGERHERIWLGWGLAIATMIYAAETLGEVGFSLHEGIGFRYSPAWYHVALTGFAHLSMAALVAVALWRLFGRWASALAVALAVLAAAGYVLIVHWWLGAACTWLM